MINKRLLIKNLLSYNDENSFYDKKERLNLKNRRAKAKFLKHICALSNANPKNKSYIVIGVEDETNKIIGVNFFDDSRIQSLIDNYLENPPKVQYENVKFSNLSRRKVVGLISIFPTDKISRLKQNIWEYKAGQIFVRKGSTSVSVPNLQLDNKNEKIVEDLENQSINNIEHTLEAVLDFMGRHRKEHHPNYKVFKEQYVLCWAGKIKKTETKTYYTRVDIELVNEQIQLYYSDRDKVKIFVNNDSFIITEYVSLGIQKEVDFHPLEKTILHFKENGSYKIHSEIIFSPPQYSIETIQTLYAESNTILDKMINQEELSIAETKRLVELPSYYLLCYLNGIKEAANKLSKISTYLMKLKDKTAYKKLKETKRILRKLKT